MEQLHEHSSSGLALLSCLCPDLLMHGIYEERNEDESRGLKELEVLNNVAERVVYTDVHTVSESRDGTHKLVGMVHGKYGNDSVRRLEVNGLAGSHSNGEDVLLSEHNALTATGCNGGEEEFCKLVLATCEIGIFKSGINRGSTDLAKLSE